MDLFLSIFFEFYESLDLLSISWSVNLIDRFFVESFILCFIDFVWAYCRYNLGSNFGT